jgi:hypothetical protein
MVSFTPRPLYLQSVSKRLKLFSPVYFSTLKIEATRSSETSILTRSTQCHISKDIVLHSHLRENLKSHNHLVIWASLLFVSVSLHAKDRETALYTFCDKRNKWIHCSSARNPNKTLSATSHCSRQVNRKLAGSISSEQSGPHNGTLLLYLHKPGRTKADLQQQLRVSIMSGNDKVIAERLSL